jgi:hypothetical protein
MMRRLARSGVIYAPVAFLTLASAAMACNGCGCRGGPGYRLASGNCVSWAQHEKHKAAGDFPQGARCEHPEGCSLETPQGVKLLEPSVVKN